jgi:hypothetical protein
MKHFVLVAALIAGNPVAALDIADVWGDLLADGTLVLAYDETSEGMEYFSVVGAYCEPQEEVRSAIQHWGLPFFASDIVGVFNGTPAFLYIFGTPGGYMEGWIDHPSFNGQLCLAAVAQEAGV